MLNKDCFEDENSFETLVGHNIYWVPLKNVKIDNNVKPMNNLSDIALLMLENNFLEINDNIIINENGINWEHHKPSNVAYNTNAGCCATTCSFFAHFLQNKIKFGYLSFHYQNAIGHALIYVYYNEFYYFIDPSFYSNKGKENLVKETGIKQDFMNSIYKTAFCLKSKIIINYIKFLDFYLKFSQGHCLFLKSHGDFLPPIAFEICEDKLKVMLSFEDTKPMYVSKNMKCEIYNKKPNIIPNWE